MAISMSEHFADLPDPWRGQGRRHSLSDMIVIAVTAVICAADSWSDVHDFGKAKLKWLKTFLDLRHGIPSQDTFERVFSRLDPDSFERCLHEVDPGPVRSPRGSMDGDRRQTDSPPLRAGLVAIGGRPSDPRVGYGPCHGFRPMGR
jgi:hypothetical protein